MKSKINTYTLIGYLIFGFILNSLTLIIFFLSVYMNPSTYHGGEGHNNGVVTLVFTIPLWVLLLYLAKKRKEREAFIGIGINAIINFLFYVMIAFSECLD